MAILLPAPFLLAFLLGLSSIATLCSGVPDGIIETSAPINNTATPPVPTNNIFVSNIYGGHTAQPTDYSYFVQFLGCGGALIAPDVVLTAAHCNDRTGQAVYVGAYRTLSTEYGAQKRTCTLWKAHPGYDGGINDVALCRLDHPVAIDQSQARLVLNRNNHSSSSSNLRIVGEELVAMGFGRLDGTEGNTPTFLQQTQLEGRDCGWMYSEELQICAGGPGGINGVTDVCRGDSGGPLIKIVSSNGAGPDLHYHVGLVSFGARCPTAATGVYARTSGVVAWIDRAMCEMDSVGCNPDLLVTQPPKNEDEDNEDGTICGAEESRLVITVKTDLYAHENQWVLEQQISLLGGAWTQIAANDLDRNNVVLTSSVCLDKGARYRWTITDVHGDGLCDPYGNCGSFAILLDGEELVASSGDFGSEFVETFETTADGLISSPPRTNLPSKPPTKSPTKRSKVRRTMRTRPTMKGKKAKKGKARRHRQI